MPKPAHVLRFLAPIGIAAGLISGARAAEPAIIAKARAALGAEAALNAIQSVRYTGTVVETPAADPAKATRAAVEILAQKPDRQRITRTSDKTIDINGLDGYEGWQRVQDAANPKNWRQIVLPPDALKRMRAQARENLMFFGGLERMGGAYEDEGAATIDGVACQKIAFVHGPGIVFHRYFNTATGRLVQTETDDGTVTREDGELIVNGVRFPKTMTITTKPVNGKSNVSVITFEKITVNESLAAKLFAVPPPEH